MAISARQYPRELKSLCVIEVVERFSFHIIRGILVLYMVKILNFSDANAYNVFAVFTALLYFTPLLGGYFADKFLNAKQAVLLGGLTLSLGYFCLYIANLTTLYIAYAFIAIGNGFFMPNIANCIGDLTGDDLSKRESYFSLFYSALNFGAFLSPFITTLIIYFFNWNLAFLVSSIMMLIVSIYLSYQLMLQKEEKLHSINLGVSFIVILFGGFISSFVIQYTWIANLTIYTACLCLIIYIIKICGALPRFDRKRLSSCFFLILFSIIFWALSEQSAMSLAIFTEYNINRVYEGITISTLFFFSLNPLFVFLLGPCISKLWSYLNTKNLNPPIPAKFAIGTILMGLGFLILPIGIYYQNTVGEVNLIWLILSYFLQSCGELVFAPIGMSMIVELSPKFMSGLMMGLWYFATAIAYLCAGYASQMTTSSLQNNQLLLTSVVYSHTFSMLGWIAILFGIMLLFITPLLNNLMKQESTELLLGKIIVD